MANPRYTATLAIFKTETKPAPAQPYSRDTPPPTETSSEVAKIVVRAATLESLRSKVAGHVALIEEGE